MPARNPEPARWLDHPGSVQRIINTLLGICVLLLLADAVLTRHTHFGFERWFGFYGLYGFISCVFLVRVAALMRKLLMRSEDYYEPVDDGLVDDGPIHDGPVDDECARDAPAGDATGTYGRHRGDFPGSDSDG